MVMWTVTTQEAKPPRTVQRGFRALNHGDVTRAQSYFARGIHSGDDDERWSCLIGLAGVAAAVGDIATAEHHLAAAWAHGRTDAALTMSRLMDALGDPDDARMWQERAGAPQPLDSCRAGKPPVAINGRRAQVWWLMLWLWWGIAIFGVSTNRSPWWVLLLPTLWIMILPRVLRNDEKRTREQALGESRRLLGQIKDTAC